MQYCIVYSWERTPATTTACGAIVFSRAVTSECELLLLRCGGGLPAWDRRAARLQSDEEEDAAKEDEQAAASRSQTLAKWLTASVPPAWRRSARSCGLCVSRSKSGSTCGGRSHEQRNTNRRSAVMIVVLVNDSARVHPFFWSGPPPCTARCTWWYYRLCAQYAPCAHLTFACLDAIRPLVEFHPPAMRLSHTPRA